MRSKNKICCAALLWSLGYCLVLYLSTNTGFLNLTKCKVAFPGGLERHNPNDATLDQAVLPPNNKMSLRFWAVCPAKIPKTTMRRQLTTNCVLQRHLSFFVQCDAIAKQQLPGWFLANRKTQPLQGTWMNDCQLCCVRDNLPIAQGERKELLDTKRKSCLWRAAPGSWVELVSPVAGLPFVVWTGEEVEIYPPTIFRVIDPLE